MIVLSQQDKRWSSTKLGFSNLTIGKFGCTLTCLTMLLNHSFGYNLTPDQVNSKLKSLGDYDKNRNPHGAFQGALIVWSNVPRAFPNISFTWRGYNYDNLKVSYYVYIKRLPVMVEVNASSIGASRHWCLYLGDRKMADPWTGRIVPTNTYPSTGYSLFDKA